jgi:hypothetical protein
MEASDGSTGTALCTLWAIKGVPRRRMRNNPADVSVSPSILKTYAY